MSATLEWVLLFGSRARGDARPDSDVDLLLIFRSLPPDREPQATQAEEIADAVAEASGVPVATWSVALIDLEVGRRTPMLVDALEDGITLWPPGRPCPVLPFTEEDALACTDALLERVAEGSEEVAELVWEGDIPAAAQRIRDDLVRLSTAHLLLSGETRPRRAAAPARFLERVRGNGGVSREVVHALEWAIHSFGPEGRDADRPVPPPPCDLPTLARAIDDLRLRVRFGQSSFEGG